MGSKKSGIHPIVTLDSTFEIDNTDSTKNGSSAETAVKSKFLYKKGQIIVNKNQLSGLFLYFNTHRMCNSKYTFILLSSCRAH